VAVDFSALYTLQFGEWGDYSCFDSSPKALDWTVTRHHGGLPDRGKSETGDGAGEDSGFFRVSAKSDDGLVPSLVPNV